MSKDKQLDRLLLMNEISTVMRLLGELLAKSNDIAEERKLLAVLSELSGCLYSFIHYSKRH